MKKARVEKVTAGFDLTLDSIAADKSISHRCAMFSLLSDKPSVIKNFLLAEDTLSSLSIAKSLGAKVEQNGSNIKITPPKELKESFDILDCGNAGTGMRLYCGLLAGISGSFVLTGDKYLRSRPMARVVKPLIDIGAVIDGREKGNKAPLHIRGGELKSFEYHSPIDSAQVKSALILAALNANMPSYYAENFLSRDHTERMLKGMGAKIETELRDGVEWIKIEPLKEPLEPLEISVPADPSSGFFFAVAAAIMPESKVIIKSVSLNKTRVEAYEVLKSMGAKVDFILKDEKYEPIGDIVVEYNGRLNGVNVNKNIAWLIDELPALSIAMATANGVSKVENAKELRVKESDRVSSVVNALISIGAKVEEYEDGYKIEGVDAFNSATIDSCGDHRVAMSFSIASMLTDIVIEDIDCIDTSFPNFFDILQKITKVDINED